MLLAVSEITREVDRAMWLIGGTSLVMLFGITLAMVIMVFKYRRSRTPKTTQIHGHMWLETAWIVIPTLIVFWMFWVGYRGFALMRNVPADAMVVEVTGKRWLWAFHYPVEKLDTSEMVVPVNRAVKVELTAPADDVSHSFFIPDFRVKEDAVAGKSTHLWFQADRVGTYNIFCAEFCGKGHSEMLSILRVVSQSEYDAWIAAQRAKRYEPLVFEAVLDPQYEKFGPAGLDIDAPALYKTYCQSCHGAAGDGSGLPGVARSFLATEGWKNGRKVTDIYRTLTEGIQPTQMRAFPNLIPWERLALAHYVQTFFSDAAPVTSQEDYAALTEEYGLDKVQEPKETIPVERAMEILSQEAQGGSKPSDAAGG